MRRRPALAAAGLVGLAALAAACGSSQSAYPPAATSTTRPPAITAASAAATTSTTMDMTTGTTPKPLAVRADGLIDPAKVDLSGVPGVTAAEQKRAEDLLRKSILTLPKWADYKQAEADGYRSIGDGITGEEHFLRWEAVNDNVVLDPSAPESLVYKVDPATGKRTLEAAMFIMPERYNLSNVPDIGGALTQFHIHDNLCFSNDPKAPKVVGLTNGSGKCPPPFVKFRANVMLHVWIRPNRCGPFAALEGVGAGQIKPGTQRACDMVHGAAMP
ncbi:MAG: hypothetical protein HYX33_04460 [Actinobacteria bacterium]|nr:hypothetical protein [Actinomycetota bacterium]